MSAHPLAAHSASLANLCLLAADSLAIISSSLNKASLTRASLSALLSSLRRLSSNLASSLKPGRDEMGIATPAGRTLTTPTAEPGAGVPELAVDKAKLAGEWLGAKLSPLELGLRLTTGRWGRPPTMPLTTVWMGLISGASSSSRRFLGSRLSSAALLSASSLVSFL